ncbi:MAG TPA: RNA polymerase sigma factor [Luteibaculaceae bacterium]|nr:RNA polymerase sigma factor [Luteibaculaceae bacterium]
MSEISQELEQIIEGCARNDRKSQQLLHKKYYRRFMAICLRYTTNFDQAEDILQNSFIKIFNNIEKYKFEGSFDGWMKRIVVNTAIDYYRGRKNDFMLMPEENGLERLELVDDDPDEETEYPYSPAQVMEALQELTPAYKTVFNLYVIEDYSHKEIADMLNISIGTSKSNLLKSKIRLKKILEKKFGMKHAG